MGSSITLIFAVGGKKTIKIHLGTPREQWFESYAFYSKYGYQEYEKQYMKKELETKNREEQLL